MSRFTGHLHLSTSNCWDYSQICLPTHLTYFWLCAKTRVLATSPLRKSALFLYNTKGNVLAWLWASPGCPGLSDGTEERHAMCLPGHFSAGVLHSLALSSDYCPRCWTQTCGMTILTLTWRTLTTSDIKGKPKSSFAVKLKRHKYIRISFKENTAGL